MALSLQSAGFSDALVILGAAGIVIPAFARAKINPVIGFILVGLAVGPAGLGRFVPQLPWLYYVTISEPHAIEPFAELGIVLLLFSIGLELSFKRLWAMRAKVFGLGAAELAGCGLLLALALAWSGQGISAALGLGFALALSSTALVLPIAGTTGPVGQRAFAMLLFEDLALVPIIFVLAAISPHGGGGWEAMLKTLLTGTASVAVLLVIGRFALPRLFAQAARTKSPELFLAASLLVVILASIATGAAGLSPIVGALLAGILIAETDYHEEVEAMTAPFKGLALGVFLITVGMSLDLETIAGQWSSLLIAVAAVVAIKALVTDLLLRVGGARPGVALNIGLMMAAPGETTLIVLTAARAAGVIGAESAGFWQVVTAIGMTITPLLASAGGALNRRASQRTLDEVEEVEALNAYALIIGFGRVGRLVAQMLEAHSRPYLAIDADSTNVAAARARGYKVRFGDAAQAGMIDKLGFDRATAVILTMDDPVQVNRLTRLLRDRFADLTIVARARDPNHAAELYRAGATDAVPETVESSLQLSEAVLVDLGVAMGPVIASIHDKRAELRAKIMEMAEMDREPRLVRRRLEDS
ncbi:CPA2 family monovalent cation:H+ antiporter-2 [Sphingomonas vulcanisoli]|uniref:CPA2 family monovalent cation:H+ antiporter-2 n=1 Tax=Sphingomonas vulcanisoli TaxID=1658060 RepID=A0ABX0TSG7_9SPHN|nr:cation:proton antiporter [Sphingomonas vulcanisoli]NIJ08469.1 CPA2 family monovalent cation:H+ antiporter-2 [Sphingomonas vulcanisoli]